MKTVVFGAGPMGCLYTHLLNQSEKDVRILARGSRYRWIKDNGLLLVNEVTGARETSSVPVVSELRPSDNYDLVIVLVRKNKLPSVFQALKATTQIKNILFMGNNTLGFDQYLQHLPAENLLFGFPGAGGGLIENVVHYADREKPKGKRGPITLGELDGKTRERTRAIQSLFETSGIPVDLTNDIDGWLKYHVALVSPLAHALYQHDCDNYALAKDNSTIRVMVRAAKEGGRVLKALGYSRRQPFRFNLFYWLPEMLSVKAVQKLLKSKFAEVAFALHARAAQDEMRDLANEFQSLIDRTALETPNIHLLNVWAVSDRANPT